MIIHLFAHSPPIHPSFRFQLFQTVWLAFIQLQHAHSMNGQNEINVIWNLSFEPEQNTSISFSGKLSSISMDLPAVVVYPGRLLCSFDKQSKPLPFIQIVRSQFDNIELLDYLSYTSQKSKKVGKKTWWGMYKKGKYKRMLKGWERNGKEGRCWWIMRLTNMLIKLTRSGEEEKETWWSDKKLGREVRKRQRFDALMG